MELDAARPPQMRSLSSLLTPHYILLVNGRLAMMSMVGGVGGELLLRKPFAALLLLAPPAVLGLMVLLSVASIIPFMLGEEEGDEVFGPFTPAAEALNGKVAMAALIATFAIEAAKGSPIF
ncbi:hypothetical protein MNEG_1067 [Monoraphidium neglectum]|uniref:Uncharacterized protein n=1 Tax=Monoraphidium neglectum TaxID=145388 RepID=A0A0D2LKG0_9CHLO|nr:hypothetical protein MNEG_1067 [Monoraphidium neglectum]KIZ06894.1 hypothetical protein MNEG_1067 [Monoraphidium neglectum]|eukprot:XP_013905913.1 hypothetical protein MNEG_1067 [Monoraphidium neglectum]